MATRKRSFSEVKVKEVKLLHMSKEIRTKLISWGLGGLFSVGWSNSHETLVQELHRGTIVDPSHKYRGHPDKWTAEVWREVYHLPRESPDGYVVKGKVQFPELKLLKLVKGEKRPSKSGVLIDQVKSLGKCNEPTCLGPYLAHLYTHFKEMGSETTKTSDPEPPNKRKAQRQEVSDSETETEEKKEVKKEPSSSSQLAENAGPCDQPVDINDLGIQLFGLRKVFSEIFRVLHLDPLLGSVVDLVETLKKAVLAATPALTVDLKPWKEMIARLVELLGLERQKRKKLVEQHMYLEEKLTRAGKVPKMAIWCAHQLQAARETETRLSAMVETLKKELTSRGLSVPSEASANEIAKLEGRLQECTNTLASLLGQNPPTGGSEPDSDDSHVAHIVDLARMMIAEE
ncbi:hypothetical protein R1sor_005768 [Riccia sorocarpa]|uniref:Uncharacterized protein n=1 Tax=Riccia sorocarpa TaxID=122646 RepID=A0ABD3HKS5_9MARC